MEDQRSKIYSHSCCSVENADFVCANILEEPKRKNRKCGFVKAQIGRILLKDLAINLLQ